MVKLQVLVLAGAVLLGAAHLLCAAPIHDAARSGDVEAAARLLDDDQLSENSVDASGRTPLSLAAAAGQRDLVSFFLERGALVNSTNDRGATPLHFAASRGDSQIVRVLIEHGAVVNARADSTPAWPSVRWASVNPPPLRLGKL